MEELDNRILLTKEYLQLLDAAFIGKILFQHQPHLTKSVLQKRVYRLRDNNNLPMKLISRKWLITLKSLEQWIEDKGL